MKDFLGKEIAVGSWVVHGGKGNGPAEYGMIAYRVDSIRQEKLFVTRLMIHYPNHKDPGVVSLKKCNLTNPNAVLLIEPTEKVLQLFRDAAADEVSEEDRLFVGRWLHGAASAHPWEE